MKFEMKLQKKYFELIKSGEKIFEVRLNDEKRQQIRLGDEIVFSKLSNAEKKIETTVIELFHFGSFKEMVKNLPLNELGFASKKEDEVVAVYHSFYSEDDEKKFGVVAIKIVNNEK